MKCWLCEKEVTYPMFTNSRMLCQGCLCKPRHRYYQLNRPPGIGCQPDGFIDRWTYSPCKDVPLPLRGDLAWPVHGWVDYPEPLPDEDVWKKELWPANEELALRYVEWRERFKAGR